MPVLTTAGERHGVKASSRVKALLTCLSLHRWAVWEALRRSALVKKETAGEHKRAVTAAGPGSHPAPPGRPRAGDAWLLRAADLRGDRGSGSPPARRIC